MVSTVNHLTASSSARLKSIKIYSETSHIFASQRGGRDHVGRFRWQTESHWTSRTCAVGAFRILSLDNLAISCTFGLSKAVASATLSRFSKVSLHRPSVRNWRTRYRADYSLAGPRKCPPISKHIRPQMIRAAISSTGTRNSRSRSNGEAITMKMEASMQNQTIQKKKAIELICSFSVWGVAR